MSTDNLAVLLRRLGPDFAGEQSWSNNHPMPLVTLEEFFDGNDDGGSLQCASLEVARPVFTALRERSDVADVRIGITQWDGAGTWPLGEYLYLVTSADAETVAGWLKKAEVWADEYGIGNEHREREPLDVPDGMHVVWVWFD